jgi:hypothetical protein
MNLILKSAVGASLALAAVGANALGVPSMNSSDLVLVIQNESTPANVYVLDTGISISSALGAGSVVTGASLNSTAFAGLSQTIAASSTLAAFLQANPAAGDGWTLEAAQYSGGTPTASPTNLASKAAGKAWGIFTSSPSNTGIANTQLGTFQGYLGGIQGDLTAPTDSLGLSPLKTATEASTGTSFSTAAQGKYGILTGLNDVAALGASSQLFALTGNGSTGSVQSYTLGTATLSVTGQLVLAGNGGSNPPPVPLPPAVWLFGSGLLGLVGVSRRRKTAV